MQWCNVSKWATRRGKGLELNYLFVIYEKEKKKVLKTFSA
jgi:hypothetical protein